MTNDELNRKVATLQGWKIDDLTGRWIDEDGDGYDEYGWPPDYCADPAMWGRLFQELAAKNRYVALYAVRNGMVAGVDDANGRRHNAQSDTPGRALALACLASQEARQ